MKQNLPESHALRSRYKLAGLGEFCDQEIRQMNVRVLPLIFVTTIFMFAWNGDRNAMQAAIARRDAARAVLVATASSRLGEREQVKQSEAVKSGVTVLTAQAGDDQRVPLPREMAACTYQAVNQSGRTIRVSVPATEHDTAMKASREFYIHDAADGSRWYLVRIEETAHL